MVTLEKLYSLDWTGILETAAGIVLTIAVSFVVLRLARRGFDRLGRRPHVSSSTVAMLKLIVRWVILVVAALLVITQLGIKMGSIWAVVSAFLAIAGIGFVAVWSVLSNVSATILLLVFHPFGIGDEIEVIETTGGTGLRGRVAEINFMYTTLEEHQPESGETLDTLVPNSMFFQKTIRRRLARPARGTQAGTAPARPGFPGSGA
jgi:small-conductance mechanosensitive channel